MTNAVLALTQQPACLALTSMLLYLQQLASACAIPIFTMIPSKPKLALLAPKLAWSALVQTVTSALNATLIQLFPQLINASATQDTTKIP